jgi:hypothetical protein
MQLCFGTTPTTLIPTFLTDDFGDELCVIPGEWCRVNDDEFELRIVNHHAWDVLCASVMRMGD